MTRTLTYADAVRLLGGKSELVNRVDRITGGLALATATTGWMPALLGWLGARGEFARLCHDLVRRVSEQRSGLSRYSRTQRLEAAHAVLVVAAYFDALAQVELPFQLADLELTGDDQTAVVFPGTGDFGAMVQRAGSLLPGPLDAHETRVQVLREYYADLSGSLVRFVAGLAVWDRLSEMGRDRFRRTLDEVVPPRAGDRYEELLRRLAAEFPEVAYWTNLREHKATRTEVRSLGPALADLERMLSGITTGGLPDERREGLARAYRAALDQPVVTSGDVPDGLRLPTLGAGYIPPRFRAAEVTPGVKLSEESWWDGIPVRADLEDFLAGHLTSGLATRAPLLVLGQPGAGKSVLTRVLAARLPAADFLPVRVVLRDVPAAADVQEQIEQAIRGATGERMDWPALARTAGDALPVVILDGFDELLQATGVAQTDYLARVAEFQRREAVQGRPVAMIVTSRISVADRARVPDGAVSMRLEPFDTDRVTAWLAVWNAVNREPFRLRGTAPLTPEAVLAHPELAGQPLLLLMLALYDADGNALQRTGADLRENELYERLLRSFARREVEKHRPGLPDRDLDRAVEQELRRLSVVAFAMFNRGTQWVTEADLEADLPALFGEQPAPVPAAAHDLRAPLRAAQIVLGRFFFVHRAQASRDETRLETYEFLHATFGEFLVARFTWQVLRDVAAREAASTMSLASAPINDDLLHALLSYTVLSQRAPIIGFLTDLAATLSPAERETTTDLLVRLFRVAHQPRSSRGYATYQPRTAPVPARHAAYGANLVLLTVCVGGSIRASQLFGQTEDTITPWKFEAMLWRSQLAPEGWPSIVETLRPSRIWEGVHRDLHLELRRYGTESWNIDPFWTYDHPPGHHVRSGTFLHHDQPGQLLHRNAYFSCRMSEDLTYHAIEPFSASLGATLTSFVGWDRGTARSAAHALLDAWLLPLRNPTAEEQREVYGLCARIATYDFPPWDSETHVRYATLLLDRLATDPTVPTDLVADILARIDTAAMLGFILPEAASHLVRCGLTFLGRNPDSDRLIAPILSNALRSTDKLDPDLVREATTRLRNVADV